MTKRTSEDEYFAKEDALKKQRIAKDQHKKQQEAEREELKKLHHNHCPQCGQHLEAVELLGAKVERCLHCKGAFFHAEDLEKLLAEARKSDVGTAVVQSVLDLVRKK